MLFLEWKNKMPIAIEKTVPSYDELKSYVDELNTLNVEIAGYQPMGYCHSTFEMRQRTRGNKWVVYNSNDFHRCFTIENLKGLVKNRKDYIEYLKNVEVEQKQYDKVEAKVIASLTPEEYKIFMATQTDDDFDLAGKDYQVYN